jgi:hypothetical protein
MAARIGCNALAASPAEQARDTDVLLSAGLARMDAGRTAAIGPLAPDLLDRRGADVPLSILESHGARQ